MTRPPTEPCSGQGRQCISVCASVRTAGRAHRFPQPGSRNALCTLIGQTLLAVENREYEYIRMGFSEGAELTVPLDEASRVFGEGAHFVPECNGPIQVY